MPDVVQTTAKINEPPNELLQTGTGVQLTLVVNRHGLMTKSCYAPAKAGDALEATPAVFPKVGWFIRRHLGVTDPMAQLAGLLEGLSPNQAIIPGTLAGTASWRPLGLKDDVGVNDPDGTGPLFRGKGCADYRSGEAGLVMLDYDTKGMTPGMLAKLKQAGGFLAVMTKLIPGLAAAGHLIRPSVNNGFRDTRPGGVTKTSNGLHLWFVAKDAGDIPRFRRVLELRLWCAGYGCYALSNGARPSPLRRTIIDTSASGVPDRLCFEADAVLNDAALAHVPGARACTVVEGPALDTTRLADLTPLDEQEFSRVQAAARLALVEPEVTRLTRQGMPKPKAEATALAAIDWDDLHRLRVADRFAFDEDLLGRGVTTHMGGAGHWVRGRDVLLNAAQFDRRNGADPLEPAYPHSGGAPSKNMASWYPMREYPHRGMLCHSFAHGRRLYLLAFDTGDIIEAWNASTDDPVTARLAMLERAYAAYVPTDREAAGDALRAAGVPSGAMLAFGQPERLDPTALLACVGGQDWSALARLRCWWGGVFDLALREAMKGAAPVDVDAVEAAIAEPLQAYLAGDPPHAPPPPDDGKPPLPVGGFRVTTFEDAQITELPDCVENLMIENSLAMLVGIPGAGKTYLILDLLLHVALGWPWHGREVDQGPAMLFALEGRSGVEQRIAAFRKHHQLDGRKLPFVFTSDNVNLFDAKAVGNLIAAIKAQSLVWGQKVRLVAIDTLAMALGGGDENSAEAMGPVLINCNRIREATGACIVLVHHVGKDASRGPRGHSGINATLSTLLEIQYPEKGAPRRVIVRKQRDLEVGEDFFYRLKPVNLGTNRRGKLITSCVVEPITDPVEIAAAQAAAAKLKPREQTGLAALRDALKDHAMTPPAGCPAVRVTTEAMWKASFRLRLPADTSMDASKMSFRRMRLALIDEALVGTDGTMVWLTEDIPAAAPDVSPFDL